jgi:glycosyltransferase involved in cell wall biosynthesis
MVGGKKVVVVLPAYNAEKTLRQTYEEIPRDVVDAVLLVDDASTDRTVELADELGIEYIQHPENLGYGGNQKTCYRAALDRGADIVAMLHPDYQYSPKLLGAMAHLLNSAEYDAVLGSRILGGRAVKGGMPRHKYVSNRVLTLIQNILLGAKLSEYHTGYRAYTREVLEAIPWENNSNDFLFDNQMLSQIIYHGFMVGEITCPAKYFPEASSIGFFKSTEYGVGCLITALQFRLNKLGLLSSKLFQINNGERYSR